VGSFWRVNEHLAVGGRRDDVLLIGRAAPIVRGDGAGRLGRVLVTARKYVQTARSRDADAHAHNQRKENGEDGWPPPVLVFGGVRRVVLRQRRMNSDPTNLAGHTLMRRR